MLTRIRNNEQTGRGMYMKTDASAGTVVYVENHMAAVEFTETGEKTFYQLGGVMAFHYEGWTQSNLLQADCFGLKEQDKDHPEVLNHVAAMNIAVRNGFNRSVGKNNVTHMAFYMGGCFFNACRRPNAESLVCMNRDGITLRVVLHQDLKAGDQVFLGYDFDGECGCGTDCTNRPAFDQEEKSRRLGMNLDVYKRYDSDRYINTVMAIGKLLEQKDKELPKKEVEQWIMTNKHIMAHVFEFNNAIQKRT